MLTIRWDEPISLGKLVVHFDTDYDHALESVLRGHPEREIPFCVKKWRLLDLSIEGSENELFLQEGNYQSRVVATIDPATSSFSHWDRDPRAQRGRKYARWYIRGSSV